MLTPVIPPYYLTINQSENCTQADYIPATVLPHLAFKNALLKPFGGLGVFEHEPPVFLVWCLTIKLHFPSPQPGVSRLPLLCMGEWTQVWFANTVTPSGAPWNYSWCQKWGQSCGDCSPRPCKFDKLHCNYPAIPPPKLSEKSTSCNSLILVVFWGNKEKEVICSMEEGHAKIRMLLRK